MDLIQAVVLGLIQGITEWLPISSQGQTVAIALTLFGIDAERALSYSIFLHIGTLAAAIFYFRKELKELIQLKNRELLKFLAIALIATAFTALPSYLFLKSLLGSAAILLFLIGFFLIITGLLQLKKKIVKGAGLSSINAILLGFGQGFSVLPGISRSGTTTSVLLFEGFEPEKAFRLSFLLSIPAVLIAEILFGLAEPFYFEFNLLVALAVAAIAGFFSIKYLIGIAKRVNFGLFCIIFGIIYLILAVI